MISIGCIIFVAKKESVESLNRHGLLEYVWAPEFNKGDILAFTNFTMHATHCLPTMTLPRTSVEVRVNLLGRVNMLDKIRVNLPRPRSILDRLRNVGRENN
jgi:hypothetical protein